MTNIHAHVSVNSRDCDGMYDRSHVSMPDEGQDRVSFKFEIWDLYSSPENPDAQRVVTEHGFECWEQTDEGYSNVTVRWCEDDDADVPNTFRDHTAESMGY